MSETVTIETGGKKKICDITSDVNKFLRRSKAGSGLCHVFILHTTAAVTTADLDPGTDLDMLDAFEEIVPKLQYRHPHNPAHVGDHIMSTLIGPGVFVPVVDGELLLGRWQRVILVELDGPRSRSLHMTFISE